LQEIVLQFSLSFPVHMSTLKYKRHNIAVAIEVSSSLCVQNKSPGFVQVYLIIEKVNFLSIDLKKLKYLFITVLCFIIPKFKCCCEYSTIICLSTILSISFWTLERTATNLFESWSEKPCAFSLHRSGKTPKTPKKMFKKSYEIECRFEPLGFSHAKSPVL
jgi:hypothetical protein